MFLEMPDVVLGLCRCNAFRHAFVVSRLIFALSMTPHNTNFHFQMSCKTNIFPAHTKSENQNIFYLKRLDETDNDDCYTL